MAIGDEIAARWRRDGVPTAPGVGDSECLAFERAHGACLPDDFRRYLQIVNGTLGQLDGDLFCFWSLRDIRSVATVLEHRRPDSQLFERCFVFADYSISAWFYAIQLVGDDSNVGQVFLVAVDGTRQAPLAQTFSEFGRFYLADAQELYGGRPCPGPNEVRRPWWPFW
jgi:hypothetical protein